MPKYTPRYAGDDKFDVRTIAPKLWGLEPVPGEADGARSSAHRPA
jgi:hypothetical protein